MPGAMFGFALRDLRSGGRSLVVFCACLMLGVMLVAATGGLFQQVRDALLSDTRALFGGDVEVRDRSPLSAPVRAWLDERGDVSLLTETRTMVVGGDGEFRIVELQAVDDIYPLYGTVETAPAMPLAEALAFRDGAWGGAFDPLLAEQLGFAIGDRLQVGGIQVELRALVRRQPDRSLRAAWRGPPLLLAADALNATGLIAPGAQVAWRYRLRTDAELTVLIDALARSFPDADFEVRTFDRRGERIAEVLGQLASGLLLIAFSALFIGGLGVFNSVHAYLQGKRATLATLRALGLRDARLALTYLTQIVVLATLASLLGVMLGGALALAGARVVANSVPIATNVAVLLEPLGTAFLFGILTAVTFSLPALGRAVSVPPAILFRGEGGAGEAAPRGYLIAAAVCALSLVALVFTALPDTVFAAGFVIAVLVLLMVFEGLVRALRYVAPRIAERPVVARHFALRLGLANLYRPGSALRPLLLSLGSALTLLVASTLVVLTLLETIDETVPRNAPDLVFHDIQTDQLADVRETLESQPGLVHQAFVPLVLGRLVAVNGEALRESSDARRALESRDEHKLTHRADNIDGVVIEQGAWWPADYSGPPLLAMEDREAGQLGLQVGDRLQFRILGETLEAELAAIYGQRRYQARFWFEAVFSDRVLDPFITRYVGTARLDAEGVRNVRSSLARGLPNVVTVDMRGVLDEARGLLGRAATGLAVISAISLLASLLVLAGVVASNRARQVREAAVLHVLGARIGAIRRALVMEFALMALVASVVAVLLGSAIASAILQYRLELPPTEGWWAGSFVALGVSTAALTAGARYVLRELRLTPATQLRAGA